MKKSTGPKYKYDVNGSVEMTKMDEMTAKFSQNRPFLKAFLGVLKGLIRLFSLPGIRKIHPWVSEKHTHGVILPINNELTVDNILMPYPIISEFIDKSSYRMIMNVCGCRQTYDCKNHSPQLGCINMGEGVLDMSPGLGRLASKEEAHEHVKKAIESGLVPYIGKGRIDNALYGVPDRGKLLGLCFCCHCCCLTTAFNSLPSDHLRRLFPHIDEVTMEVTDDCTACETCLEYCIYDAITIENGKAVQNKEKCWQCGRCVTYCPSEAIKISIENLEFKDELIKRISTFADIT